MPTCERSNLRHVAGQLRTRTLTAVTGPMVSSNRCLYVLPNPPLHSAGPAPLPLRRAGPLVSACRGSRSDALTSSAAAGSPSTPVATTRRRAARPRARWSTSTTTWPSSVSACGPRSAATVRSFSATTTPELSRIPARRFRARAQKLRVDDSPSRSPQQTKLPQHRSRCAVRTCARTRMRRDVAARARVRLWSCPGGPPGCALLSF